jgi:hypothetical protein
MRVLCLFMENVMLTKSFAPLILFQANSSVKGSISDAFNVAWQITNSA